ncbi:MAG: hypothetical protein JKY89_00085 [Immundisolibacteraceae bacterium]|nr:hypothetical protein [Immundisolibacteraceae bacterium]
MDEAVLDTDCALQLSIRLREERARIGLTQQRAGELCGVSKRAYGNWESTSNSAAVPTLALLKLELHGIDVFYVMSGVKSGPVNAGYSIHAVHESLPSHQESDQFLAIPSVDLKALCPHNSLTQPVKNVGSLALSKAWLAKLGLIGLDLRTLTVVGDSMSRSDGGIRPGDLLLVSMGGEQSLSDGVYIIHFDNEAQVKRLQRDIDGGMLILSDNRSYQTITVPKNRLDVLEVIAKVERVIHLDTP